MIFTLQGSPIQRQIVQAALRRSDFPWERLEQGLRNQTGRTTIPVDWQDLSRYSAMVDEALAARTGQRSTRPHRQSAISNTRSHNGSVVVIEQGGEKATLIEWRHRVLGLAWYSGRITLEAGLVNQPELAGEVFLSEGAHMWDFFGMTMEERVKAFNAFHEAAHDLPDDFVIHDGIPLGEHQCSWFDLGNYYTWVGEALMSAFVMAFSDYRITMEFPFHTATPAIAQEIREIVFPPPSKETGPVIEEPVIPEPVEPEIVTPDAPIEPSNEPSPEEPLPEPEPELQYYGLKRSKVYHESDCYTMERARVQNKPLLMYESEDAAVAAGRRACKVCKP